MFGGVGGTVFLIGFNLHQKFALQNENQCELLFFGIARVFLEITQSILEGNVYATELSARTLQQKPK